MDSPVYLFKQAVTFGKGMTYSKGTHRIAAGVSDNPYFQKMISAGLVVKAGDAGVPSQPVSQLEKQKIAIEASKAQAKAKAAVAPEAPVKAASKAPSKSSKASADATK